MCTSPPAHLVRGTLNYLSVYLTDLFSRALNFDAGSEPS